MTAAIQKKSQQFVNQLAASQDPVTQKTGEVADQVFLRLLDMGPLPNVFCFLPARDMIRCGSVDRTMQMKLRLITEHIHYLDLCGARDDKLEQIVRLYPNLRSINLKDSAITDRGMDLLRNLPLEELNLSNCQEIERFDFQTGFSSLERLDLSNNTLSEEAYAVLGGLSSLRHLSLRNSSVVDQDLASLANLRLTHLDLNGNCMITDEGILSLANLPLEGLILDRCRGITDQGFVSLQVLPLRSLSLDWCKITDEGLTTLAKALRLTTLNLANCYSLTDHGILQLALHPLKILKLDQCRLITDEGFNALAQLPLYRN